MNRYQIKEKLKAEFKENWQTYILNFIMITVSVFLADCCARRLPYTSPSINSKKIDTIYIEVEKAKNDSLLQDIKFLLYQLNEKTTPKKIYIQQRKPQTSDTCRNRNVSVQGNGNVINIFRNKATEITTQYQNTDTCKREKVRTIEQ